MRRIYKLIIIFLIVLFQTGCLYAVRYDGLYRGKVVDQETREPIEGAVVLGEWSVYHFGLAGGYSTYYDARETVTNQNGEFVIRGKGLRILSSLQPMSAVIFKSGYSYYDTYYWNNLKNRTAVTWEGEIPVFHLKKLTMDERKKQGSPDYPSEASEQKIKIMLQEINKDRTERGLEPVN